MFDKFGQPYGYGQIAPGRDTPQPAQPGSNNTTAPPSPLQSAITGGPASAYPVDPSMAQWRARQGPPPRIGDPGGAPAPDPFSAMGQQVAAPGVPSPFAGITPAPLNGAAPQMGYAVPDVMSGLPTNSEGAGGLSGHSAAPNPLQLAPQQAPQLPRAASPALAPASQGGLGPTAPAAPATRPAAAPVDGSAGSISNFFKSQGVSDQETPYWVEKWPELVARGQQLGDPNYAMKRLQAADIFGGGGGSTASAAPNAQLALMAAVRGQQQQQSQNTAGSLDSLRQILQNLQA